MKQHMSRAIFLAFTILSLCASIADVVADENTVNLESVVVQDFDDPAAQPWFVIGSKFATEGYPKISYVNTWPIALHGSSPANMDKLNALGVAMLFDRMEYNWVDIIPGTPDKPVELPLRGRVSMLDLWIWSGNFNYYMEAYVRDYTGIVYTITLGDLSHVGWKNLRTNIPSSIPQSKKYLPKREGLSLVKLRIWTRPTERVVMPVPAGSPDYEKAIYFYIDNIKILTDTFETLFDGDSLTDPAAIEKAWGGSTGSK